MPATQDKFKSRKDGIGQLSENRVKENTGFTLLEVAMIMFIAGIVSIIVVTRFMDTSTEELLQTDVVKVHLRYAQARAMSSNVIWGIVFYGSTYSLFKNGNTTDTVFLPGEESKTLNLPSGVTFSFDRIGKSLAHRDFARRKILNLICMSFIELQISGKSGKGGAT